MNMAGDGNMTYLLFGTLVGIVLGINIAVLYRRFIGNKARTETKLRAEIRDLEKRLRQKDDYIAKAIRSMKDEESETL
jgi:gas vesicle protein